MDMRENTIKQKINLYHAKQVDLTNMQLNNHELPFLFKQIKKNKPEVEDIFLSNNNISNQGINDLIIGLENLPHIKFLDLQFNQLTEAGIKHLYNIKKTHPHIKFALHGNFLADEGVMQDIEHSSEPQHSKNIKK